MHRALGCWRWVFTCFLIYALVSQSFIFAAGIGQPAIGAAQDQGWAGFELCTHGGTGSTLPGTPSQPPAGDNHCPFCIAGAVYLNCAPLGALQYRKVVFADVTWPQAAPRLVALFINENAWPRGPPAAA